MRHVVQLDAIIPKVAASDLLSSKNNENNKERRVMVADLDVR